MILSSQEEHKESHADPREISQWLTKLYWDNNVKDELYHGFVMNMKLYIERAYSMCSDRRALSIETRLKEYLGTCHTTNTTSLADSPPREQHPSRSPSRRPAFSADNSRASSPHHFCLRRRNGLSDDAPFRPPGYNIGHIYSAAPLTVLNLHRPSDTPYMYRIN